MLCNRHYLEEFYDKMKKVLRHVIRYLIKKSDDDQITSNVYERFNRLITSWIESLSKARSTQQNKHSVKKMDAEVDFLDSVAILEKLQKAMHKGSRMSIDDAKLLTAYSASLLHYRNGHHSGAVRNLTINEFGNHRHLKGAVVIVVSKHKTTYKGPVWLVLSEKDYWYVIAYKTLVRDFITPKSGFEDRFFLTTTGKECSKVYEYIKDGIKRSSVTIEVLPPPKMNRIVAATTTARNAPDVVRRKISKLMYHSVTTRDTYYEYEYAVVINSDCCSKYWLL